MLKLTVHGYRDASTSIKTYINKGTTLALISENKSSNQPMNALIEVLGLTRIGIQKANHKQFEL